MAINSYFFNAVLSDGVYDRMYNAEDVTSYLDKIVGNGVFPNPSTQLQVRAAGGMVVTVGAGSGWINGHKMINTADLNLTLDASDVLLDRLDAVIFYVDYTTRSMGIAVKKGTLASTPVAPSMQRDSDRWELCLAQIRVRKQVTAITQNNIRDTRGISDLCGIVQGLIQQMDTTTMFAQWQAQFDAWLESVQQELQEGRQFKKLEGIYKTVTDGEIHFDVKLFVPQFSYTYDILEVFIDGLHITGNDYRLVDSIVFLRRPIKAGSVVDFVVYKSVDVQS